MPLLGPNAQLRVQGREEHDVGSLNWDRTQDNSPFVPIGRTRADRFTAGPLMVTWTAEVECKPGGGTAIDWEGWQDRREDHPIVVSLGTRTERLVGCVIDSVGNAIAKGDGKWSKSIKGKAADHKYA